MTGISAESGERLDLGVRRLDVVAQLVVARERRRLGEVAQQLEQVAHDGEHLSAIASAVSADVRQSSPAEDHLGHVLSGAEAVVDGAAGNLRSRSCVWMPQRKSLCGSGTAGPRACRSRSRWSARTRGRRSTARRSASSPRAAVLVVLGYVVGSTTPPAPNLPAASVCAMRPEESSRSPRSDVLVYASVATAAVRRRRRSDPRCCSRRSRAKGRRRRCRARRRVHRPRRGGRSRRRCAARPHREAGAHRHRCRGVMASSVAALGILVATAPLPLLLVIAALGGLAYPALTGGLTSQLPWIVSGLASTARTASTLRPTTSARSSGLPRRCVPRARPQRTRRLPLLVLLLIALPLVRASRSPCASRRTGPLSRDLTTGSARSSARRRLPTRRCSRHRRLRGPGRVPGDRAAADRGADGVARRVGMGVRRCRRRRPGDDRARHAPAAAAPRPRALADDGRHRRLALALALSPRSPSPSRQPSRSEPSRVRC